MLKRYPVFKGILFIQRNYYPTPDQNYNFQTIYLFLVYLFKMKEISVHEIFEPKNQNRKQVQFLFSVESQGNIIHVEHFSAFRLQILRCSCQMKENHFNFSLH